MDAKRYIDILMAYSEYNQLHKVVSKFTGNRRASESLRSVAGRIISQRKLVKRNGRIDFNRVGWLHQNRRYEEIRAMRKNGTLNEYTGYC